MQQTVGDSSSCCASILIHTNGRRRSQGVHWVDMHPQGGGKSFGAKFIGESCKCTPRQSVYPQAKQEFNFLRKLGRFGRWE